MIAEISTNNRIDEIVDQIFSDCCDDVECIRVRLAALDKELREEILTSDLLNAWQVFYFYFHKDPGEDIVEFLLFSPASTLDNGVYLGEYNNCNLTFYVKNSTPSMRISDDIQELAVYLGPDAYTKAMKFIWEGN